MPWIQAGIAAVGAVTGIIGGRQARQRASNDAGC